MDSGEKDKEPVDADGEVEASEPPEVALAREEVNLLLAEQQKTAALKVRERLNACAVTGMALIINACAVTGMALLII